MPPRSGHGVVAAPGESPRRVRPSSAPSAAGHWRQRLELLLRGVGFCVGAGLVSDRAAGSGHGQHYPAVWVGRMARGRPVSPAIVFVPEGVIQISGIPSSVCLSARDLSSLEISRHNCGQRAISSSVGRGDARYQESKKLPGDFLATTCLASFVLGSRGVRSRTDETSFRRSAQATLGRSLLEARRKVLRAWDVSRRSAGYPAFRASRISSAISSATTC